MLKKTSALDLFSLYIDIQLEGDFTVATIMFKRKKETGKSFPVKVCTMDAELEFSLNWKATGQELFDLVCRTIGLRETWYFGLQFHDSKGKHFIT